MLGNFSLFLLYKLEFNFQPFLLYGSSDWMENNVDPDQLVSDKPVDQDLCCLKREKKNLYLLDNFSPFCCLLIFFQIQIFPKISFRNTIRVPNSL